MFELDCIKQSKNKLKISTLKHINALFNVAHFNVLQFACC